MRLCHWSRDTAAATPVLATRWQWLQGLGACSLEGACLLGPLHSLRTLQCQVPPNPAPASQAVAEGRWEQSADAACGLCLHSPWAAWAARQAESRSGKRLALRCAEEEARAASCFVGAALVLFLAT